MASNWQQASLTLTSTMSKASSAACCCTIMLVDPQHDVTCLDDIDEHDDDMISGKVAHKQHLTLIKGFTTKSSHHFVSVKRHWQEDADEDETPDPSVLLQTAQSGGDVFL